METLNGYLDAGLIPVFHDPMRDRDRIPRPALDAWLAGFRPEGVAS
jgi:hypothetical protein